MFTIGARRRLDLRLQAGDGNALDNDVPSLGNCTAPSDAELSAPEFAVMATGLNFVDRQFPDLQHFLPIIVLETRESSVSVVGRILEEFMLLSGVETEGSCAPPTTFVVQARSSIGVTHVVDL